MLSFLEKSIIFGNIISNINDMINISEEEDNYTESTKNRERAANAASKKAQTAQTNQEISNAEEHLDVRKQEANTAQTNAKTNEVKNDIKRKEFFKGVPQVSHSMSASSASSLKV